MLRTTCAMGDDGTVAAATKDFYISGVYWNKLCTTRRQVRIEEKNRCVTAKVRGIYNKRGKKETKKCMYVD